MRKLLIIIALLCSFNLYAETSWIINKEKDLWGEKTEDSLLTAEISEINIIKNGSKLLTNAFKKDNKNPYISFTIKKDKINIKSNLYLDPSSDDIYYFDVDYFWHRADDYVKYLICYDSENNKVLEIPFKIVNCFEFEVYKTGKIYISNIYKNIGDTFLETIKKYGKIKCILAGDQEAKKGYLYYFVIDGDGLID